MVEISAQRVRELFLYDPETGVLTRRVRTPTRNNAGEKAGSRNGSGHLQTRVDGRLVSVHRIAWLYVYGRLPENQIDHINGIRDDNRIANLREATNAENMQNQKRGRSDGRSGFLGVSWASREGRWRATITVAGKQKSLGFFDTPEQAHAAYLDSKAELHPFQTIAGVAE